MSTMVAYILNTPLFHVYVLDSAGDDSAPSADEGAPSADESTCELNTYQYT